MAVDFNKVIYHAVERHMKGQLGEEAVKKMSKVEWRALMKKMMEHLASALKRLGDIRLLHLHVIHVAVDMPHLFRREQRPPEMPGHDEVVFRYPARGVRHAAVLATFINREPGHLDLCVALAVDPIAQTPV